MEKIYSVSATTALYIVIYASLATLSGCAGNGEGLDQNGRPPTPSSAGTALTADFQSIQDNVFTPVCTVCHSGATAPRGLRLDAGNSYALLVGVASGEVPTLQRVRAGNPDTSYLIQKLTGAAAVGQRMPLGGPYLPDSTINVIRQWIANGAPRPIATAFVDSNAASMVSSVSSDAIVGLRVVTTAPINGSSTGDVSQVVIGFDRELDSNLVNGSTIALERLSDDPNAAVTTQTVATHLTVPESNRSTLVVSADGGLQKGTYRLTLSGTGGVALAGIDAQPLNATPHGSGSDYTLTFTVQ